MSEPLKVTILITNLTTNDDGFGVRPDTNEGVYIPPGVTRAASLIAGELRTATIIPNNPDRQLNTPWMGIYVDPPEASPEEPRSDVEDLMDKILYVMDDPDLSYLTTAEAAAELGVEVTVARDVLNRLFAKQRVARADVLFGSNKRACNVLWAKKPEAFL
jgi:hypothetical protein